MTLGNFFFESSAAQKEMKLLESHLCSQRRESHIEKEKNIKNITVMLIKYDVIQRQSGQLSQDSDKAFLKRDIGVSIFLRGQTF